MSFLSFGNAPKKRTASPYQHRNRGDRDVVNQIRGQKTLNRFTAVNVQVRATHGREARDQCRRRFGCCADRGREMRRYGHRARGHDHQFFPLKRPGVKSQHLLKSVRPITMVSMLDMNCA